MLDVSSRGVFGLGQGFLAFESSFFGLDHILDKKNHSLCLVHRLFIFILIY
jgi:hypothetical protein